MRPGPRACGPWGALFRAIKVEGKSMQGFGWMEILIWMYVLYAIFMPKLSNFLSNSRSPNRQICRLWACAPLPPGGSPGLPCIMP